MNFLQFAFEDKKTIGKEFEACSPKIPKSIINENSVVYSFGAGEDIRYEFLLCGFTGCEMHIFDPTPRSIEHYKVCNDVLYNGLKPFEDKRFGRGDPNYFEPILKSKVNPKKIHYHEIGLYDREDTFRFYYPKDQNHVSLSIDNLQNTSEYIDLPTKNLSQIIDDLKIRPPNILKLNIEGAEVKSLKYMMESTDIRPECIAVTFELFRDKPNIDNKKLEDYTKELLSHEYDLIYQKGEAHTYLKKNEINLNKKIQNKQSTMETTNKGNIHLIVQYYNDKNADRQEELDYCVQANLENPYIIQLHNLTEENTVIPEWLANHPKYIECRVEKWLTYKMAFDYAQENLPGQNVALTNLDIFLSHTSKWEEIIPYLQNNIVLCLSRQEFDGVESVKKDLKLQKLAFANCQDTWIWKSPKNETEAAEKDVPDCDFMIGRLGCDNAIADRLKRANYCPLNSPHQFATYHYDICRGKTYENQLRMQKPNPERPEERGYYLVPDIDAVPSCDHVMNQLGLSAVHKYQVICDVMSRYIAINNSPEKMKEITEKMNSNS